MKRVALWVGIFVAVVFLLLLALPFVINANEFRPALESSLSRALRRSVQLGDLKLTVLSGGVAASNLSVADDPAFGSQPFVQAKSLQVSVELLPLIFSRKLHVTEVAIDQPEVTLIGKASGQWNFSTLGARSGAKAAPAETQAEKPANALDLSVRLVKITNGRFSLRKSLGHWKPLVLEQVNLELRDFSAESEFPFSLAAKVAGGGELKLEGKAGPLPGGAQADLTATPSSIAVTVAKLDLAGSNLNDVAPEVSGLLAFDGSGDSDGKRIHLKGRLKAEKLKLARGGTPARRTVEFDYALEHDLEKHSGVLSRGDLHIGAAQAAITGSYVQQPEAVFVKLNLAAPGMSVPELAELLPALGIVLPAGSALQGGTASAHLTMDGTLDRLVTTGSIGLSKTRLTGFDLPKKMATIERLAGIKSGPDTEIETLSGNLRLAPEGTSVQEIRLIVPAIGEISGGGNVSPANALSFKMSALLHTSGIAAVIGREPIPFAIEGTCSEPVFRPDVKGVAAEEVKRIEGGAAKAADGILRGLLDRQKKN